MIITPSGHENGFALVRRKKEQEKINKLTLLFMRIKANVAVRRLNIRASVFSAEPKANPDLHELCQ